MKSYVRSEYQRGQQDGIDRTLMCCLLALHNLYDWGPEPLRHIMIETQRIAEEGAHDRDWIDRMAVYLNNLGVKI